MLRRDHLNASELIKCRACCQQESGERLSQNVLFGAIARPEKGKFVPVGTSVENRRFPSFLK